MELTDIEKKQIKGYEKEYELSNKILSSFGEIKVSLNEYQLWKFKDNFGLVNIVFYPHKTSAGNYHVRVRGEGSISKEKEKTIMDFLDIAAGSNCTFRRKCNN
jgi:hypothetical protein